jgi:alpha-tubulin suppressor-like RCC1 family protein
VSGSIQPDSLLYSWGNAKQGKLGISDNYFADMAEGENHSQFYLDDNQIFSHTESNHNELDSLADDQNDPENVANMAEFDSKLVFTPKPQPILGLMGMKASKIVCGQDHVLAMTENREVYSWGSNERG